MKNKDESIVPLTTPSGGYLSLGLTKREHFAGLAMHGLLSGNATYGGSTTNRDLLAIDALSHADALLKQLES